jgi:HEAT repeat protein
VTLYLCFWRFLESDGRHSGEIEFLHPLFIEYFAAIYIKNQMDKGQSLHSVLNGEVFAEQWREVLLLLAGMTNSPDELMQWMAKKARKKGDVGNAIFVAQMWDAAGNPVANDTENILMGLFLSVLGDGDKLTLTPITAPPDCSLSMTDEGSEHLQELEDTLVRFGAQVIAPLMELINGSDWRVRRFAFTVASRVGAPGLSSLIDLLQNPDPKMRQDAIQALSRMQLSSRATEKIEIKKAKTAGYDGYSSGTVSVMICAADVDEREDYDDYEADSAHPYDCRAQAFLNAFNDSDPEVRCAAIDAFQNLHVHWHCALPKLIEASCDPDAHVRSVAVNSLGWNGREADWCSWSGHLEVLDPVISALKDSDEGVQDAAIHALGLIDDDRALIELLSLLDDSEARKRSAAVKALEEKGDKAALHRLEEMARGDHDEYVSFQWRDDVHKQKVSDDAAQAVRTIRNKNSLEG